MLLYKEGEERVKGLQPGETETLEIVVQDDMRPTFDGNVVHDVMSTVTMIYYMEKVGRHVILPYLEEGEEGAGYEIQVKHIGPAVVGQRVKFTALCTEVTPKRVVCEVTAETSENIVGTGIFTQAIFKKEKMEARITELRQTIAQK
ncbi:thioesterase [Aneurinibacillus sp. XH2]|nr:thioesterase [Aneurinibacillus sp. XH2]